MLLDAHLDLAYNAQQGRDITRPASEQPELAYGKATVSLPDLRRGGVAMICATLFAEPQSPSAPEGYSTPDEAQVVAWRQFQFYLSLLTDRQLDFITEPLDVPTTPCDPHHPGPIPALILMEGADPIQSPDDVQMWFDLGLRAVGLAWKQTRHAGGTGAPGPLTPEGRALIPRLDELGILHDTSHLAEESFWQLLDLTPRTVFASHSNCRAIVPTDRQLSDDMIRAIARRDGVIGINLFDKFLLPPGQYKTRRANLTDVVAHIQHICNLTGSARHVGLGTDMDGGLGLETIPQEIQSSADLPKLGDALRHAGFPQTDIDAILSGNFLRFFRDNLPEPRTPQRSA